MYSIFINNKEVFNISVDEAASEAWLLVKDLIDITGGSACFIDKENNDELGYYGEE